MTEEERRQYHAWLQQVSTSYRLATSRITIDGSVKLDFAKYPYLVDIIDDHARLTTILKGGQMGFSVACIMRSLEDARTRDLRGILYLLPTEGEVHDFAKSRFGPMLADNTHVWGEELGKYDSAALKEIGGTVMYFRGVGQSGRGKTNSSKLKSIPVDHIYYDERDEMDNARVDRAEQRLGASPNPEETTLSTPTLPEYGVDLLYKDSDQRHWFWHCERCGGHTCLELNFPECIAEPTNADPFYLCSKCREPLDRRVGQWVAAKPDVLGHRGFYASQMCSWVITARRVLEEYEKYSDRGRMKEFYNQVLARPYADIEDVLTAQQLIALCNNEVSRPLRHPGPAAMGVDPGKPIWYTVRIRITEKDYVQLARGRADSYDEIAEIARRYNVKVGVMDKGYDPTAVDNFCKAHRGWFGCLYVESKVDTADWNEEERQVKVGRTPLLDASRDTILEGRIEYYRRDQDFDEHYIPQMTNLARTMIEDPETGARKARWVLRGARKNDHLRHADAYCELACTRLQLAKHVRDAKRRRMMEDEGGHGGSFMAS